jgi:hypothetical protein
VYIETKNATQLFLSEGEDKLGTLAVAIPQPQNLVGSPLSSILLGDRNMMIARALAEILAQKTKKIGLVSVFIKSVTEQGAAPILRRLMEKTLKKEENTNRTSKFFFRTQDYRSSQLTLRMLLLAFFNMVAYVLFVAFQLTHILHLFYVVLEFRRKP